MTDTSSSARNASSSSVVCPFAKLGHLSPSAAAAGVTRVSPHRPFKAASSVESLNYSRSSDLSCSDGGSVNRNNNSTTYSPLSVSPAYRPHQQISCRLSPVHNRDGDELRFFRGGGGGEKQDGDCTRMAFGPQQQTSFGGYTSGRTSPYLDLGYHTLVTPSVWPTSVTSVGKYTKKTTNKSKCSYHMERLPDVVMLQIFSWLSTSELCSVSRVCRRWHNLAWEHALWKRITLHGEGRCADEAIKSILRRLCGQGQKDACTSVKQLYVFDGAKITDEGLTSLSRKCTELTQVQIQNCPTVSDAAVSELVTRCPSIQHLDLTGCSLVSCINILTGSDRPQKLLLQHLDLTDCVAVQDSSLRIILRNCPLLTYLYLRRCCRITDAGVKFVPSFCSSLRELSVSDCHLVTDFALYELAKLGSNLRYLSVAKCGQVSDAGLKVIAKRCYKLRYLNVRGCEAVSDDALTALARSCPRLRALDIGKCDVSDAGLKVLAENCPNLKKLSLRNCDLVTDLGVQYVCYYCRGLQQLNIQDCQISLEGYKAVKRFCKRCIIEHTNPGFF